MNWLALLAVIVSLVVLYLVGAVISAPFKKEEQTEPFYDTFVSLVVGFLAVTTLYAIVKTGGNTVQLAVLLLGVLYLTQNKITKPVFRFSLLGVGITCACSLFFFCFHGYFYYAQLVDNIPHFDNYVYAYNSYSNAVNGIETTGVYLDGMAKATPYHYIEGWLTALIASVFGLNYLETYSICLICILSSIVVVGIISLTKTYTDNPFTVVLACCTIFLSAVLLDYSPIKQAMAMGQNLKNLISALFLIGFILSLRKCNENYLWLLCLPVANAALTPVIMSTLFIFAFYQYFKSRERKKLLDNIYSIILLSIFIALFYLLQHSTFPKESIDGDIFSVLILSYSLSDFLYITYRTIVNYAMYLPYFMPLIIVFIVNRNMLEFIKSHGQLIVFLFISAICGLLCHYIYYPLNKCDSGQLDANVNMILMDLLVLTSFLFVFSNIEYKIGKCIFYTFIGIVSAYNVWVFTESIISRRTITAELNDVEYRDNISDYFSKHGISRIGARLLLPDDHRYGNVYDVLYMGHLGMTIDGLAAINLSQLNLSDEEAHWNSIIPQSNLFNGYLSQLEQDYDIDSVQVGFIKRYSLGYIVVPSSYQLSDKLKMLVDTTFVDGKTGNCFMFLRK